jgi:transcriptional regulator with XRE-family HTH domain
MIRGTWRECDLLNKIGRRVRAARVDAGMTQQELADRVLLSRPSIANLEGGNQEVPITRLALIARTLGLNLADLVED